MAPSNRLQGFSRFTPRLSLKPLSLYYRSEHSYGHVSSLNYSSSLFSLSVSFLYPHAALGVRHLWTYKEELKHRQWPMLKQDMVDYFSRCGSGECLRDSSVCIDAVAWPRLTSKLDIGEEGKVPAIIHRHGPERRVCIDRNVIQNIAFDEPDGHLSLLFSSRLFRIHVENWIEECVVSHVQSDPVEKHIYFLKFARHVPGLLTTVELPVSLVGMLASPAFIKGFQVEVAMPTVKVEVIGDNIPPPLQVDVSRLKYTAPYSAITLEDIKHLLPSDGCARFHRDYDLARQEAVWVYEAGTIPEQPLPAGYVDPNFVDKKGRRISLTYKNYWPKQ